MSNALFNLAKERILKAQLNMEASTIKAALVSNAYNRNLAHQFVTDIQAFIIGTPVTLANKVVTNGVFDADDVTFLSVPGGSTVGSVVLFDDTGTPATSVLVASIPQVVGFPLATNGGDIIIQWDNGAFKIFSL